MQNPQHLSAQVRLLHVDETELRWTTFPRNLSGHYGGKCGLAHGAVVKTGSKLQV